MKSKENNGNFLTKNTLKSTGNIIDILEKLNVKSAGKLNGLFYKDQTEKNILKKQGKF